MRPCKTLFCLSSTSSSLRTISLWNDHKWCKHRLFSISIAKVWWVSLHYLIWEGWTRHSITSIKASFKLTCKIWDRDLPARWKTHLCRHQTKAKRALSSGKSTKTFASFATCSPQLVSRSDLRPRIQAPPYVRGTTIWRKSNSISSSSSSTRAKLLATARSMDSILVG